ncbi:MAG: hypothetical protein OXG16_01585 [Rhodospirillales bacterium]|nr:hypothetical protein [Rhodospirillales bacterium]
MVDWRQGGCTGSVRRSARKQVKIQLKENAIYRRARYGVVHRFFQFVFYARTFGRYVLAYAILNILLVAFEAIAITYFSLPPLYSTTSRSNQFSLNASMLFLNDSLLLSVSGYFVTTQVGALGIIALALALVSLIAQRENSATDIKVYYRESFAFEIVASSLALLCVLVIQLLWPFQTILHETGFGMRSLLFEYCLLVFHLCWLTVNLGAIAYFINVTFRFAQQSTRVQLRERYTANIVFPSDLAHRLQTMIYLNAAYNIDETDRDQAADLPTATFGHDFGEPCVVELEMRSRIPLVLRDVRMAWIRWAVRRWYTRCQTAAEEVSATRLGVDEVSPMLWFPPSFSHPIGGKIGLCIRRNGVPLTTVEKFVIRQAFEFRRHRDGS